MLLLCGYIFYKFISRVNNFLCYIPRFTHTFFHVLLYLFYFIFKFFSLFISVAYSSAFEMIFVSFTCFVWLGSSHLNYRVSLPLFRCSVMTLLQLKLASACHGELPRPHCCTVAKLLSFPSLLLFWVCSPNVAVDTSCFCFCFVLCNNLRCAVCVSRDWWIAF